MWIGDEYFEHVKTLVLNHLPIVAEQIHANFEVVTPIDIRSHNGIVGAIEQNFSQEFDRLAFGDIAAGLHQSAVIFLEKHIEVHR